MATKIKLEESIASFKEHSTPESKHVRCPACNRTTRFDVEDVRADGWPTCCEKDMIYIIVEIIYDEEGEIKERIKRKIAPLYEMVE